VYLWVFIYIPKYKVDIHWKIFNKVGIW